MASQIKEFEQRQRKLEREQSEEVKRLIFELNGGLTDDEIKCRNERRVAPAPLDEEGVARLLEFATNAKAKAGTCAIDFLGVSARDGRLNPRLKDTVVRALIPFITKRDESDFPATSWDVKADLEVIVRWREVNPERAEQWWDDRSRKRASYMALSWMGREGRIALPTLLDNIRNWKEMEAEHTFYCIVMDDEEIIDAILAIATGDESPPRTRRSRHEADRGQQE